MNAFDFARNLYSNAKSLLETTHDLAVLIDELRWAREDLEEDLLDLKAAVIDLNALALADLIDAVIRTMAVILSLVDGCGDRDEDS